MPEQTKGINVQFVKRELLSVFPAYSVSVGNISVAEFEQIKKEFTTANREQSPCIRSLSMNYYENITFGVIGKTTNFKNLDISGMAWMDENKTPLCQKCSDKPDREKMNICERNLRNGKCCDPLIRRTLGAVLYPQFYANEKQK